MKKKNGLTDTVSYEFISVIFRILFFISFFPDRQTADAVRLCPFSFPANRQKEIGCEKSEFSFTVKVGRIYIYIITFTLGRKIKMMHPSEIEFLAENEIIQIVPTFNHASHIHLICGSFGPFRAGLPLNVPIWVALNLRQKKTCRILPPEWMTVDKLQERLEDEKASKYVIPTIVRRCIPRL